MKQHMWFILAISAIAFSGCNSNSIDMTRQSASDTQGKVSSDAMSSGAQVQREEAVRIAWLHVQDVLKERSEYHAKIDELANEWDVTFISLVPRRRGGGAKVIVSAITGKVTHSEYYQ